MKNKLSEALLIVFLLISFGLVFVYNHVNDYVYFSALSVFLVCSILFQAKDLDERED